MSSTASPLTLTPISRRRKKISLSPIKLRHPQAVARNKSVSPIKTPSLRQPSQLSESSATLEFAEFSCWDDVEGFVGLSKQNMQLLLAYLELHYGCSDIMESGPYLLSFCEDDIPPVDKRPFIIAGCVAVWLKAGESVPAELSLGYAGSGEAVDLDNAVIQDLVPYRLPKLATLQAVGRTFESADFITFYTMGLIIELPAQSDDDFVEALKKLPISINGSSVSLDYFNGSLAETEMKRLKKPNPREIDGVFDDSDYIKKQGCFFPGSMLSSSDGHNISAGVMVEKDNEQRLTVAFHCWDEELAKHPDKLGDPEYSKVFQGYSDSGTPCGYVEKRIGQSDVGLVKLDPNIDFHNRFFDDQTPTTAKVLLPSERIHFGDKFFVDGFVTGQQTLTCLGKRIRNTTQRERDFIIAEKNKDLLPPPGLYIALNQGIYATSSPIIKSPPMIRAGVCGSALVRCKERLAGNVLDQGGVAGFMQYSDLRPKSSASSGLLCYCEALDEMIEEGWKAVPVAEKRKAEDEGERGEKRKAEDEGKREEK